MRTDVEGVALIKKIKFCGDGAYCGRNGLILHLVMQIRVRYIFTLVAVALSLVCGAQINTDQVLRIGQNSLYFEDYVLSIQYFNQVIKVKPYLARPYFFRSVAKLNLGDYKGAEDDASLCIERNPFIVDAYQVRGVARQNSKKFAEAITDYDKALNIQPDNRNFLFNKALCQLQLKQYHESDSTFRYLVKRDKKNERIYLGLAQICIETGDTTAALEFIQKSLGISKNSATAYAVRAQIEAQRADFQAASADMDSLIKLEPKNVNNYINRAYFRYKADDYFGCLSDYDYAITLDPENSVAVYNRAQLNFEVGEYAKAIADFTTVLKRDPQNFLALYNRLQLYLTTEQYRKALGDYDRILKKYPNFESGYLQRAAIKQKLGDMKGAQRDNERAIAIFKKKGIRVSSFNPAELEMKKAEKKIAQEIEDAKKGVEQPASEEDIIKKFNQLLTVEDDNGLKPEYDNRSRGHIQNQNVDIEPMPMFALSYYSVVNKLNGKTHYMKEVTEVNDSHLLSKLLVLSDDAVLLDSATISRHFESIDYYNAMLAVSKPRSVDYFGRAMDHMMVKDYESAIADADRAIALSPKFALAYFLRANARYMQYQLEARNTQAEAAGGTDAVAAAKLLAHNASGEKLSSALDDFGEALKLSPKSVYALYNRGLIYTLMGDYTSAIGCFSEAIAMEPDFGEAYYNRGLMYFKLGNRDKGVADLSQAGELGVLPSYNVLKRMSDN